MTDHQVSDEAREEAAIQFAEKYPQVARYILDLVTRVHELESRLGGGAGEAPTTLAALAARFVAAMTEDEGARAVH